MNRCVPGKVLSLTKMLVSCLIFCLMCALPSVCSSSTAEAAAAAEQRPVIVLPGIMGSELLDPDGSVLWPSLEAADIRRLRYEPGDEALYVDGRLLNNTETNERVYGIFNTYKPLVDRLAADLAPRPVYFFSYDWRLDAASLARELDFEVRTLAERHQLTPGTAGIDIVAHSMGGLVTSAYMKLFAGGSASCINRIITCGTPYEGSPVTLERTLPAVDAGMNLRIGSLKSIGFDLLFRYLEPYYDVIRSFPSMLLLMPTIEYIEQVPIYRYSGKNIDPAAPVFTEREYLELLGGVYGANDVNRHFPELDSLKTEGLPAGPNYLLSLENTWFIAGSGQRTIQTIAASVPDDEEPAGDALTFISLFSEDGDGTVPLRSATMLDTLPALLAGTGRYLELETDHQGTCMSEAALDWIVSILED